MLNCRYERNSIHSENSSNLRISEKLTDAYINWVKGYSKKISHVKYVSFCYKSSSIFFLNKFVHVLKDQYILLPRKKG